LFFIPGAVQTNGMPPSCGEGEGRRERAPAKPRASNRQTVAEAAMKSVVRSVGSSVGRALVRGILGSLKKGF
jgi:hypothetical protein